MESQTRLEGLIAAPDCDIFHADRFSGSEVHMKTHSCSFLSRLALPGLMSLILLAPAIAGADTFDINVDFGGGLTGTGSFNTDGTCNVCLAGTTLTNFTFTVDDDTLTEAQAEAGFLLYNRSVNTLGFSLSQGGDNPSDEFGFSGATNGINATFVDTDDSQPVSLDGAGTISAAPAAVPEPTSVLLLAGVIGCLAFDLKRRLRKKSVIH
jgi:hypothetical protein